MAFCIAHIFSAEGINYGFGESVSSIESTVGEVNSNETTLRVFSPVRRPSKEAQSATGLRAATWNTQNWCHTTSASRLPCHGSMGRRSSNCSGNRASDSSQDDASVSELSAWQASARCVWRMRNGRTPPTQMGASLRLLEECVPYMEYGGLLFGQPCRGLST
jgi:hypothetical protein